jgi:shikimate kinase
MKENVYLIGCRAVGKSSIGKKLAQKLSYAYFDTDVMITESQNQSVTEIVERCGWQQFRKYEKEVLQQLQSKQQCVVATGGGAIVHSELWPHLKKQGRVVWLTASLDVLYARIRNDNQTDVLRPSLTGKDVCRELEDVLKERSLLYKAASDYIVDTGKFDVSGAVSAIEQYLME